MCKRLCEYVLLFLSGNYLGMKWSCHMTDVCLTFKEIATLFPKWLFDFTVLSQTYLLLTGYKLQDEPSELSLHVRLPS